MARCAAAQYRASPTCSDCREVPRFDAWCAVTDAVDAGVRAQQYARSQSALDLGDGQAGSEELRASDYAVRGAGKLSKRPALGSHNDP